MVHFDEIGYFVTQNLIEQKMAYEGYSPDVEKAWCNVTVQETIGQERATDKSKNAQSDPVYGDFEKLAKEYLKTDAQSCNDVDSTVSRTTKKKRNRKAF